MHIEGFAGAYVPPGEYQASVSIGDAEATAQLTLLPDRRLVATQAEFTEVQDCIRELTSLMNELLDGIAAVRKTRGQIEALLADHPDAETLQEAGTNAVERLTTWERQVLQVDFETYEDEDSLPPRLVKQVRHLLDVIDDAGPPVAAGALERLADLQAEWAALGLTAATSDSSISVSSASGGEGFAWATASIRRRGGGTLV